MCTILNTFHVDDLPDKNVNVDITLVGSKLFSDKYVHNTPVGIGNCVAFTLVWGNIGDQIYNLPTTGLNPPKAIAYDIIDVPAEADLKVKDICSCGTYNLYIKDFTGLPTTNPDPTGATLLTLTSPALIHGNKYIIFIGKGSTPDYKFSIPGCTSCCISYVMDVCGNC